MFFSLKTLVLVAYAVFRKGVIKCTLGAESIGYVIRSNTESHLQDRCKLYYITFIFLSLVSCYRRIVGCKSSIVWGRMVQVAKRLDGESSKGRINQMANRTGGESPRGRNVQGANWQSGVKSINLHCNSSSSSSYLIYESTVTHNCQ